MLNKLFSLQRLRGMVVVISILGLVFSISIVQSLNSRFAKASENIITEHKGTGKAVSLLETNESSTSLREGGKIATKRMQSQENYQRDSLKHSKMTIPSSYDSRESNPEAIYQVRNQGGYGTCWAHAATASAYASERLSNLGTNMFSPKHLVYSAYSNSTSFQGGWADFSTNAASYGGSHQNVITAWSKGYGPESESSFPYTDVSTQITDFSKINQSLYDLKNATELPYPNTSYLNTKGTGLGGPTSLNTDAMESIKETLIQKGVVDISYYEANNSSSYNPTTYGYYNPWNTFSPNTMVANHSVTLVGYDDSYSANNFVTAAPGNGAFLIQNSWGTDGDQARNNGYFWISYYDPSLVDFVTFDIQAKDGTTPQFYDKEAGYGYYYTTQKYNTSLKFANRFTSPTDSATYLSKTSFTLQNPNSSGTVKIYKYASKTDPEYGTLVATKNFTSEFAGYQVVNLDKKIYLPKGTSYSIVVTLNPNPNAMNAATVESSNVATNNLSYDTGYDLNQSESFLYDIDSTTGKNFWNDLADTSNQTSVESGGYTTRYGNFDVKGYIINTNDPDPDPTPVPKDVKVSSISVADQITLTPKSSKNLSVEVLPTAATNKVLKWTSINSKIASVNSSGRITGNMTGVTKITIQTLDGSNIKKTVIVNVLLQASNPIKFSDIGKVGKESKQAIEFLSKYKITQGVKGKQFAPHNSVTRLQMALFIYRMAGSPSISGMTSAKSKFKDLKGHGSEDVAAVTWLLNKKITGGYGNGYFGVNDVCSRMQMSLFLTRYAKSVGAKTSAKSYNYHQLKDWSSLGSSEYKKAVNYIISMQISVMKKTYYKPLGNCTREGMALFLKRFYNYVLTDK